MILETKYFNETSLLEGRGVFGFPRLIQIKGLSLLIQSWPFLFSKRLGWFLN